MSYRRKGRPLYSSIRRRTHLPALNVTFRSMWDRGLDEALARIEQLRSEGWNIDDERGALTQSQAERFAAHVEKHGFETVRIPVAKWEDDEVQFVAYKPKAGQELPVPTPPTPEPKAVRVKLEFDPIERFQKMVQSDEEPDGGVLMEPGRTMAVIRYDANPTEDSGRSMVNLAKDIVSNAQHREPLNCDKLSKAEKMRKSKVKIGESHFDIAKVKRAMRVIGKKSTAYLEKGKGVLAVRNQRGDMVLIAPVIEPAKELTIPIEDLKNL